MSALSDPSTTTDGIKIPRGAAALAGGSLHCTFPPVAHYDVRRHVQWRAHLAHTAPNLLGSDEATFVTTLGLPESPPTHALGAATFAPGFGLEGSGDKKLAGLICDSFHHIS